MFPDAVKKFNENKLFSEIADMSSKDVSEFVDYEDEADYMQMIISEREDFLFKHGIDI